MTEGSSRIGRLLAAAGAPKDAAGAALFRALFGVLCFVSMTRLLAYGWVEDFFVTPKYHFRYAFAPFVERLSPSGMYGLVYALMGLALLMAAGVFFRAAALAFFLGFSYLMLIDVTNYVNHYYLVAVLALWMALLPLGRAYGLLGLLRGENARTLPAYVYWCLRLQIGVVYTFAGVAKLTSDWMLYAQPLDIWLAARAQTPVLGAALAFPLLPHLMSWAGAVFDLSIPWLLSSRRTRVPAYLALVVFHVLTKWMLPYIGMFPFIMSVAATIFFAPDWPRRLLGRAPLPPLESGQRAPSRALAMALVGLGALQVLLPLRAFAHGGNVLWHEQGMRFSWRVVVREKTASVTYLVRDPVTGRTREVSPRSYLDKRQAREFAAQPDLIVALAKRIAEDHPPGVEVYADAVSSLNGRPHARLIDPRVDLLTIGPFTPHERFILDAPSSRPPNLFAHSWHAVTSSR